MKKVTGPPTFQKPWMSELCKPTRFALGSLVTFFPKGYVGLQTKNWGKKSQLIQGILEETYQEPHFFFGFHWFNLSPVDDMFPVESSVDEWSKFETRMLMCFFYRRRQLSVGKGLSGRQCCHNAISCIGGKTTERMPFFYTFCLLFFCWTKHHN